PHTVSCYAQNGALDAQGNPAQSATQSFSMTIRQPTAAAISFDRIADALRCHRVRERIPGSTRIVIRHGHRQRVHTPTRTRKALRCVAQTTRKRVTVIVRRHGHAVKVTRVKRVVMLPHAVSQTHLRVGFGRPAVVSGVLLAAGGAPLADQPITVIAAPDNGLGQFAPVATATTSSTGTWTATLPPGPSRLVEAVYAGSSTTEPASSGQVKLTVPARISMSVTPRVLPWRRRITIRGQLDGGYIPAKGVPLELYIRYPSG